MVRSSLSLVSRFSNNLAQEVAALVCLDGTGAVYDKVRIILLRWAFYTTDSFDKVRVVGFRERPEGLPLEAIEVRSDKPDKPSASASAATAAAAAAAEPAEPADAASSDWLEIDPLQALIAQVLPIDAAAIPLADELDDGSADDVDHNVDAADADPQCHRPDHDSAPAVAPQPEPAPDAAPAALRIQRRAGWHFFSGDQDVGWLHHLGTDSIKATCKLHKKCSCVVSMPPEGSVREQKMARRPSFEDISNDLTIWLDSGLDLDELQHAETARVLKRDKYAMKVRR